MPKTAQCYNTALAQGFTDHGALLASRIPGATRQVLPEAGGALL